MRDKEREGAPKKFEDAELQALLGEDSCLSLDRLAKELNVDRSIVGKRLHAMRIVQKEGNWMPYKLKERNMERRLVICEMLHQRQQRKDFLHRIITGDEKWIYYDNPKRLKAWVMSMNQVHQRQNEISMLRRLYCASDGIKEVIYIMSCSNLPKPSLAIVIGYN